MNILAFVETRGGKIRNAGLEALAGARRLAELTGGTASALLIGQSSGSLGGELGNQGVKVVYTVDDPALAGYTPEGYLEALLAAIKQSGAQAVVLTATALGRDLAPMAAARLDAAFLPDCISLGFSDGKVNVTRPVYAGRLMITLAAKEPPMVISLRPKAFTPIAAGRGAPEIVPVPVSLEGKISTGIAATGSDAGGRLDVTEADVIVSGGRGMKAAENFKLLEDLADILHAAVGASRAVVDAGWRPHSEQVGQTGKVVSPTLYFAFGISGAIQHLAGMRTSKVIVAINKDSEAPIFKAADYGIVGDALEVVPALTQALKAMA